MSHSVTMNDVARRVGVHRATVSNVLNGRLKSQRSDAARRAAEIRRVAEEMGYRPSVAARATRTGKTGFIGMIRSPQLSRSVHAPLFESAMDEALHQRGFCLVRDIIDDDADEAPRIVRERVVDGLIVNYAFGTPRPVREVLDRCRVPAVWVNRRREANCVHPADEPAGRTAAESLLSLGHRHIAYVRLHGEDVYGGEQHYSGSAREAGYAAAMIDAGLVPRVERFQPPRGGTHFRRSWILRSMLDVLNRPDRPTALVCSSHGREAVHAAAVVGLNVPDDVSVFTFDDDAAGDQAVAVDRLLTPYAAMARAAMGALFELIDRPDQPLPPVALPFEFHRTGTVAPPRPCHSPTPL